MENTFEMCPEEIEKMVNKPLSKEEKKAAGKMSWGIQYISEMNEVRIFPMNGNQIVIHGKGGGNVFHSSSSGVLPN